MCDQPFSWFDFLRIEGELALTFIQSAKLYSRQQDSDRALNNARKALAVIRNRLGNRVASGLTGDEIIFLETRCSIIESQLAEFR